MPEAPAAEAISRRFIFLYVLAYGGLFVAFIPFFSILLPLKVEAIAAPDRVAVLSRITIVGALVASVANIVFGILGDRTHARTGSRRSWILAGLVALAAAYGAVHLARGAGTLLAAIIFFQIALNILFASLVPVMADEVPDSRKGLVAGFLGCAHPIASLAGVLVTLPALWGEMGLQFTITCALASAMLLPFILLGREQSPPESGLDAQAPPGPSARFDLVLAWAARLSVQVAGVAVMTYLYFYLDDFARAEFGSKAEAAQLIARAIALATAVSVALTIICGRLSDRMRARKPLLLVSGAGMAAGLLNMAWAWSWTHAAFAYGLFTCGYSVFMALHAAYTMQLLPSPRHHGRDLGFFNLTNTLPAVTGPLLAILLVADQSGFHKLWTAAALLAALGTTLVLFIRGQR